MSPHCFVHSIIKSFINLILSSSFNLPHVPPLSFAVSPLSSLKLYLRTFIFFQILCSTLFHKIRSILPSSFNILISTLLSPPHHSYPLLFPSLSHTFYYYYQTVISQLSVSVWSLILLSNRYRSLVSLCVVSRLSQGHTSFVFSVAFGPGGLLASGSSDNTIKLWDLKTGKNVNTLTVCQPSLIYKHSAL